MAAKEKSKKELLQELQELRFRLAEAEETLEALRRGTATLPGHAKPAGCAPATLADSNARQWAEAALLESEERYRLLVDHSPEAIVVHTDGVFVFVNGAGVELFGGDNPEQFLGKSVLDFIHPDFRETIGQRIRRVQDRGEEAGLRETRILRLDGRPVEVEATAQRIIYQGKPSVQVLIRDITARKQAEEALRENEARFRAIFEGAPIGVVLSDATGRLLSANSALEQMLGYRAEELADRSFEEITHPEDVGKNLALFREALAGQRDSYRLEKRYLHKDGHHVWADLAVSIVRGADGEPRFCIGMVEDITARKQAEAALEALHQQLEQRVKERTAELESAYERLRREVTERRKAEKFSADLFASPLIGFYIAQDRKFKLVNPGFEQTSGFSLAELQDRECLSLVHPEDREMVRAKAVEMLKGQRTRAYEYRTQTSQGETKWILETVVSSHYQGKPATLGNFLDITLQKQAEANLAESAEQLRFLAAQLLAAQEKERQRLARDLHDDLGQSMMVLKLQMRAVERSLSPEMSGTRQDCLRALEFIDEVIDNVRRLSRDLSPALLEDLGLFEALKHLLGEFARLHKVKVRVDLEDITKVFHPEVEIIIYRIFQELLTNIAKHAEATEVAVAIKKEAGAVSFRVGDNGRGFDRQQVQADDATQRGLGLAAMDERVRMLGGELRIVSRLGQGTHIAFTIPLERPGS